MLASSYSLFLIVCSSCLVLFYATIWSPQPQMVRIVNKTPTTSNPSNNNEDKNKQNNTIEVTTEKTNPPDAANANIKNTINYNINDDDITGTSSNTGTVWEKDLDPHPRKKQKISPESPTSLIARNNNNVNSVNNRRCIIISRNEAHTPTESSSDSFSQTMTNQLRPVLVNNMWI